MRKNILIVALLLQAWSCWAHVFPVRSDPPVGATVMTAPIQVSILFDDEVEPASSTIEVKNGDQGQVDKKDSHIDSKDPDTLIVGLPATLSDGEYHVAWKALAQDGHLTMGHFSFWVKGKQPD